MVANKLNRFWTLIIILLVAIIVIGGIVAWSRCSPGQDIEISISPSQAPEGGDGAGGEQEPQKIDINRAEVWLLEALPGIGETLAQRIVDYRQQNGPFQHTNELLKVAGIGTTTYEQIKHLITVAD